MIKKYFFGEGELSESDIGELIYEDNLIEEINKLKKYKLTGWHDICIKENINGKYIKINDVLKLIKGE